MRISVTTIESYRLWSQPDQEWMTEEALIATIRGEFSPTPAMLLGQAFGRALEKPDRWRKSGGYEVWVMGAAKEWVPYWFSDEDMAPAFAQFDRSGVFEVKGVKSYGGVDIVTKADQMLGTRILETKTKLTQFDFDRYHDSYQWRFMLDIFGASQVTYNVFCLNENARPGQIVKSVETFNEFPYPSLHDDCCALLRRFLGYVAARNLQGYLQEKVYA